jgi:hypothetical protein
MCSKLHGIDDSLLPYEPKGFGIPDAIAIVADGPRKHLFLASH